MRKLTRAELTAWTVKTLNEQGGRCAVCRAPLRHGKSVVHKGSRRGRPCADHDHDHGHVRGVLCNTCNTGEGKLRTVAIRYGYGKDNYLKWVVQMAKYLHDRAGKPCYPFVHPEHETEEDKRIKRNKKARDRRKVTKETR